MMVIHSSLPTKAQQEKEKQGMPSEEEKTEEVKITYARPVLTEEVKESLLSTTPQIYEAHVVSGARPREGIREEKKLNEEKVEAQPHVKKTLIPVKRE